MDDTQGLGLFWVLLFSYFIPSLVAGARKHHQGLAIFMLNMLLGWTVLGWVGALIWSCTATRGQDPAS